MNIKKEILYNAFMSGAIEVMDNRLFLNQINVFPVADSDTGSNLYNMMNYIIQNAEIKPSLKATLESIADSAIVGARGNSGLIFAQYFHGISMVGEKENEITADDFVSAAKLGFIHAYDAVEKPVEGTILTTMRVFYESLNTNIEKVSSFQELLENAYKSVENAVARTTEQLINLKRASVVDSGAKGFSYFLKGFIEGLSQEKEEDYRVRSREIIDKYGYEFHESLELHDSYEDISYRYCTEALVESDDFDLDKLKNTLHSLGDSIVVSSGKSKRRIHIHTNEPAEVFRYLSSNTKIINQKVDDMKWQYEVSHNRQRDRVIVTDSIADIPKEMLDENQVAVINLDILLDTESYIDKLTISNSFLFEWIERTNLHPTSSQPSILSAKKMLNFLLSHYKEVIIITVSKELSGTYNVLSKASLDFGDSVKVIDSKQNSVAEGLLVLSAVEALKANLDTNQIVDKVKDDLKNTKILVSIANLDRMIASGRVTSRVGKMANLLGLKPIVTLDEDGAGAIGKIALGRKDAKRKIIKELIKVNRDKGIEKYALTYLDDRNLALDLARELESALGFSCIYIVESSSIIAAGAGKGAVAVAYTTH